MDIENAESDRREKRDVSTDRVLELVQSLLQETPFEWTHVIGMRAALRVLPVFVADFKDESLLTPEKLTTALISFRASFISWSAARHPNQAIGPAAAAASAAAAARGGDASDLFALVADATAETVAGSFDDLGRGNIPRRSLAAAVLVAGAAAGGHAADQVWNSITTDANWLAQERKKRAISARELVDQRLWLDDVRGNPRYKANFPLWARQAFDGFAASERVRSGNWRPWVTWYRAILPNGPRARPESAFGEKTDIEIAMQPPSFWERDADQVMADINLLVEGESGFKRAEQKNDDDETLSEFSQPEVTNDAATGYVGETRLEFLSDVHDPTVDYLNRGRVAFVLAARLNQIWDAANPAPTSDETAGSRPTGMGMRYGVDPLRPGFVVHIDAPWGGGKTSFASFLTQILNPYRQATLPEWLKILPLDDAKYWPAAYRRPWHVVSFNAWRHQHVKPPWWVFYDAIRRQCKDAMTREKNHQIRSLPRPSRDFDYRWWPRRRFFWLSEWITEQFWRLWTPDIRSKLLLTAAVFAVIGGLIWLDVIRIGSTGIELALGVSAREIVQGDGQSLWLTPLVVLIAVAPLLWTVSSAFTQTLFPGTPEAAKNYSLGSGDPLDRFRKHFASAMKRFKRPIVVVVDDLDRCEPEYVVELVRGMQTILLSSRLIFVLLGDRDWIEQAFSETHKAMKAIEVGPEHEFGGRFVEKAIQFSLVLPDLPERTRHSYVRDLLELGDGNGVGEVDEKRLSDLAKDFVENLKAQTAAVLAVDDYAEREAKAAEVRESPDLQVLDEDEKDAVLYDLDVKLSLRAAADFSAQRETSHMIEALAPMLPPNPRQIKRIVNAISLMQEVARLEGFANPGTAKWQIMARWIVLMIEWPRSWYTLSRYPGLANKMLDLECDGSGLPDDDGALLKLLRSNEAAMKLLSFSNEALGWPKADITSDEIAWLRTLMPATSGRVLDSGAARSDRSQ